MCPPTSYHQCPLLPLFRHALTSGLCSQRGASMQISRTRCMHRTALMQVYPRYLTLAAQSSDPLQRLQWVVTYFMAGACVRAPPRPASAAFLAAGWLLPGIVPCVRHGAPAMDPLLAVAICHLLLCWCCCCATATAAAAPQVSTSSLPAGPSPSTQCWARPGRRRCPTGRPSPWSRSPTTRPSQPSRCRAPAAPEAPPLTHSLDTASHAFRSSPAALP